MRLGPKRTVFPHLHAATMGGCCPVLDPRATWRMSFDLAVACAVLAAVVVIPFDLAFIDVSKVDSTSPIQGIVTVIDAIFFVDIVLKFNTAIFDKKRDQWCLDRSKIARRYLRQMAVLDVLAIVPWRYIARYASSSAALLTEAQLRRFNYLSLLKLLRYSRILELGAGQGKGAKFPTSKAPLSVVSQSFRLICGRAIISRSDLA